MTNAPMPPPVDAQGRPARPIRRYRPRRNAIVPALITPSMIPPPLSSVQRQQTVLVTPDMIPLQSQRTVLVTPNELSSWFPSGNGQSDIVLHYEDYEEETKEDDE